MSRNSSLNDFNRYNLDLKIPKVVEILPEYFGSDYPKLIDLLETYYKYLDSDGSFNEDLRGLLQSKDINGVSSKFLNYLLYETGSGLTSDQFDDPRAALKGFPDFYRVKGSLFSIQKFFKALYNEEPEIVYPKDQLFTIGESKIGANSLKIIQDGKLNQTLSILIKTSLPISTWESLYKKMVHPAGFYLGGEVLLIETGNINVTTPDAISDSNAGVVTFANSISTPIAAITEPLTGTYVDSSGTYSITLEQSISLWDSAQISNIDGQYNTVLKSQTSSPPTFDIDSDGINRPIDFSNKTESFDKS